MENNLTPKERNFIELENACSESYRRFLIEQYRELFGLNDNSNDMSAPAILHGGGGLQPGYSQLLIDLFQSSNIRSVIRQSDKIATEIEEQLMALVVDTEDAFATQSDPFNREKELLEQMQSLVDDAQGFNALKNTEEVSGYLEMRLSETDREFFNQSEGTKAMRQNQLDCWRKAMGDAEQEYKNGIIGEKADLWLEELKRKVSKVLMATNTIKRLASSLPFISDIIWYCGSGGKWSITDLRFLKLCDDIISHNKEITEIAEMIGRMASAEEKLIEEHFSDKRLTPITITSHALKSEMVGVHLSDDLSALLPSEVAMLASPHSESLFYKRFVEKKLQTFDFIHREKEWLEVDEDSTRIVKVKDDVRGPIIVCLDTSGSMKGKPEMLAKAMCLALMQIAMKENRSCFLITFSTKVETFELTSKENMTELVGFISHSFHGGTDIDGAIIAAMDKLNVERYRRADVLAISDFCAPHLPPITLARISQAKENKTRFHALATIANLTNKDDGRLLDMEFFDNIWQCDMESDLTSVSNLANCIHNIKKVGV